MSSFVTFSFSIGMNKDKGRRREKNQRGKGRIVGARKSNRDEAETKMRIVYRAVTRAAKRSRG
jgi:hypothetical protein